ncbi:hypothetical protein ACFQZC_38355 [Streptacidiphilus monticola]
MTSSAYAAGPGGVEACPSNTVCLYYNSPAYGWGPSSTGPQVDTRCPITPSATTATGGATT